MQELDTLIHSIYYLRVSLREKWMEDGSACGELVRSSWSSFVDLVCLYLKAPVARLQRSIFVDGEGPSSADWLMERMDHAEELMTMMLTEGCTARQRYLLRVLQDQLIEFRTAFLVRRRLMLSLHQLRMQQKKSCAREVAARTLESRLLRRSASVPPNVEDMALVPCMCE